MTESNSEEPLIEKFRTAFLSGRQSLQSTPNRGITEIGRCHRFIVKAKQTLGNFYGRKSAIYKMYDEASTNLRNLTDIDYRRLVSHFGSILEQIETLSGIGVSESHPSLPPEGKNVFVIHGHDETNCLRLEKLLQNHFLLSPVRMMDRPGMGLSLLGKFEQSASVCALAFAIFTPDDEVKNRGRVYPQARPNVIFEAGWFVGRLGISRVCLLVKDGTTVQSDIDGISRIYFGDSVEEKALEIQRELRAFGLVA